MKSLSLQNLHQNLWDSPQNLWRSVTAPQLSWGCPSCVWPSQLVGWHWTSAEPRHCFHPLHHSHKAVRSCGLLALLLMLPFPWVSCSSTAFSPLPVPPRCSWLSVHYAVRRWVLQYPQESSWAIHHLPHGSGALPCHTACQDEAFSPVKYTSVSWLRVPRADFTFWAEPSVAGGREHQQNPQPSFREKETCCVTLLLNHSFLKAMLTLASSLVEPALDFGKHCINVLRANCLIPVHVLLIEGSQITHSSTKHEEDS